jgi:hypothetical protein
VWAPKAASSKPVGHLSICRKNTAAIVPCARALDHAWEYGFVLAYPRGKEEQTGYQWEPWHYRYVGVEDAKRLEKKNLSLQEFLEREGAKSPC